MTRQWFVGIPVVLLAMTVATVASAEPLRIATAGDRMGSLATGLRKIGGAPLGSCAVDAPAVRYVNYVAPGRPADDDNASFRAVTIGEQVVAVVAYDEQDLSTPVHANMDGNGPVTNVWSVANAPAPCTIVPGVHYQPVITAPFQNADP